MRLQEKMGRLAVSFPRHGRIGVLYMQQEPRLRRRELGTVVAVLVLLALAVGAIIIVMGTL